MRQMNLLRGSISEKIRDLQRGMMMIGMNGRLSVPISIFLYSTFEVIMLLIISSISHDEETQHGKTYDTIMKFVRHYDHRNCTLFMNNFFTSPQLMKDLALKVIAVCGSVQLNRRGMPPKSQLNDRLLKSLHRGQSLHFQKDNMCLAIWKDASVMKVLSNHI
jgi:hypothetical protein